jgi:hypothetical protein
MNAALPCRSAYRIVVEYRLDNLRPCQSHRHGCHAEVLWYTNEVVPAAPWFRATGGVWGWGGGAEPTSGGVTPNRTAHGPDHQTLRDDEGREASLSRT